MTEDQTKRWQQIKNDFMRNKSLGGDDANTGSQIVTQLADLVQSVQALKLQ